MRIKTSSILALLVLSLMSSGCKKKPEPVPVAPPTAEAIAAFTEAAYSGDVSKITEALKNGMPVDQVETNGNSALMFAAAEGLSPIVDILLAHGADPKLHDKDNDTAAGFARNRGFTDLADKLQALIDAP